MELFGDILNIVLMACIFFIGLCIGVVIEKAVAKAAWEKKIQEALGTDSLCQLANKAIKDRWDKDSFTTPTIVRRPRQEVFSVEDEQQEAETEVKPRTQRKSTKVHEKV